MNLDIGSIGRTRKKLGITQIQLARLAGVSQSLIAKIESGEVDPTYTKAIAIFRALEDQVNTGKDNKKISDIITKNVIAVNPSDPLKKVITIMKEKSISQLPVLDNGKQLGSINDSMLAEWFIKYGTKLEKTRVGEVMEDGFPTVPPNTSLELIAEMLGHSKAILVIKNGLIIGIITKADLIKAMK